MKVKQSQVVKLLISGGFKTADKFTPARLLKKIEELPGLDWADNAPSSPKLLDALVSAVESGDKVTIVNDVEAAEEAPAPAKKVAKVAPAAEAPAKKSKAKAKPVEEEEVAEDEEEEVTEDDDEPAVPKKAAKKKAPAGAVKKVARPAKDAAPKGPGVISVILDLLTKATERKPISKEGLLESLTSKFPDRVPDAMASTINAQVPSRLSKEKGVVISKNNKGYWIEADAK